MSSSTSDAAAGRRQAIISQPIGRTLFTLTMPMLYALIAIMGLGLVDSYFISDLGTQELAAIGFIVPIAFTMTSVSLGLGMAISALTSKLIGADKLNLAARLITDGFYLTFGVSLLLVGLLSWQLKNVFVLIGAQAETMPAIMDYMHIWLVGSVFLMLTQVCSSTFRAIGDTKTSANISIIMTLVNLVLDPILIFGWGPIPALGMQGAAIATVIAVMVSVFIGLYSLAVREKLLIAKLPDWHEFKQNFDALVAIAIPAMLANAIVPITAAIMTSFAAAFGTSAVAGFGVGGRIESVSLIIIYALSSTLPMFIGQNLGAGNKERVAQAIKLSFKFTFIFQLLIYLVLALFSAEIAAVFSDEQTVQNTIQTFLWLIPLTYGLGGIVILINVAMNVLGKPKIALYINVIRLLLITMPLAYLGSYLLELKGLFIGIALGNVCAFFLAYVLLKRVLNELKVSF